MSAYDFDDTISGDGDLDNLLNWFISSVPAVGLPTSSDTANFNVTVVSGGTCAAPATATGTTISGNAAFNSTFSGVNVIISAGAGANFYGAVTLTGTPGFGSVINGSNIGFNSTASLTDTTVSSAGAVFAGVVTLGIGSAISNGTFNAAVIADNGNNISGGTFFNILHMAGGGTFSGGTFSAGELVCDATIVTSDPGAGVPVTATGNCDFSATAIAGDITSAGGIFGAHTYGGNQTWIGTQTIDAATVFSGDVTTANDPVNGTFTGDVSGSVSFSAIINTPGSVTCTVFTGSGTGDLILSGTNVTFQWEHPNGYSGYVQVGSVIGQIRIQNLAGGGVAIKVPLASNVLNTAPQFSADSHLVSGTASASGGGFSMML